MDRVLLRSLHIDEHVALAEEVVDLVPVHALGVAPEHIGCGHAGGVDWVSCGAVLRGVGQFEVFEVIHTHACTQRGCEHVDARVRAFAAHDLGAEYPAVRRGEQQLDRQVLRSRVVGRMGVALHVALLMRHPQAL